MKRNMELVRTILIDIEAQTPTDIPLLVKIPGYSHEEVNYHLILLHEAGLIEAQKRFGDNKEEVFPERLTWAGHEFLDSARNDNVWNKTKEIVMSKGGDISFEILKGLLSSVAMSFFTLKP
jgi:predicted transcriptional regulator